MKIPCHQTETTAWLMIGAALQCLHPPLRLRCYGTEGHSILMCSPNALFHFSLFNLIHLLMEILFFLKVRLFIRHIKYVEFV